jgi:hypothetical protein
MRVTMHIYTHTGREREMEVEEVLGAVGLTVGQAHAAVRHLDHTLQQVSFIEVKETCYRGKRDLYSRHMLLCDILIILCSRSLL